MSLKKTKAFLELYSKAMPPGYPAPGGDNARAALAEIAALEKAAKALVSEDTESADVAVCEPAMARYLEAMAVMETIAKEAE